MFYRRWALWYLCCICTTLMYLGLPIDLKFFKLLSMVMFTPCSAFYVNDFSLLSQRKKGEGWSTLIFLWWHWKWNWWRWFWETYMVLLTYMRSHFFCFFCTTFMCIPQAYLFILACAAYIFVYCFDFFLFYIPHLCGLVIACDFTFHLLAAKMYSC
jgi:hypothetical protein